MATVAQIGPRLGIAPTCAALGLPRATYYRRRRPARAAPPQRRSPRALGEAERAAAREQLTVHADRGSAMTSKPVALLLADLGVTKTHSRPHVSNDNPFSEAQFKTLKYRPEFPGRFGSIQDARAHAHVFFPWYNTEHHHAGLGLLTPADVHHGLAEQRVAARAIVLATAYAAHPERFPGGLPQPPARPTEVWINPPATGSTDTAPDWRSGPELC